MPTNNSNRNNNPEFNPIATPPNIDVDIMSEKLHGQILNERLIQEISRIKLPEYAARFMPVAPEICDDMKSSFIRETLPVLKKRFSTTQPEKYAIRTHIFLKVLRHFIFWEQHQYLRFHPVQYTLADHARMGYDGLEPFINQLYAICSFSGKATPDDPQYMLSEFYGYFAILDTHRIVRIKRKDALKLMKNYEVSIKPALGKDFNTSTILLSRGEIAKYIEQGAQLDTLPKEFIYNWALAPRTSDFQNKVPKTVLDHLIFRYGSLSSLQNADLTFSGIRKAKSMDSNKRKKSHDDASTKEDKEGALTFTFDAEDHSGDPIASVSNYDYNSLCPPNCEDNGVV